MVFLRSLHGFLMFFDPKLGWELGELVKDKFREAQRALHSVAQGGGLARSQKMDDRKP